MEKEKKFKYTGSFLSINRFVRSFKSAFNGFIIVFQEESNFKIQIIISIITITLTLLLNVPLFQVILLCGLVLSAEAMNTAIENIMDLVEPKFNPIVKKIKDISAASVFIATVTAVICGLLLFYPPIISLFN